MNISCANHDLYDRFCNDHVDCWLETRPISVLFKAVESYNAAWSHSFGSYLTNRLLTHYARSVDADDDRGQARRRLSPEQIRERLTAHARAHGVALQVDSAPVERAASGQRSTG